MAWEPQAAPLKQLAQFLSDSLSGHDKSKQKTAELMLKNAKTSPDINNYLTFLFADSRAADYLGLPQESLYAARSAAAIMLKNDIKTSYKTIPDSNKAYIKENIVRGLQDPLPQMRGYAGNVITEIVKQGGVMGWPQILSELITVIANESGNANQQTQEGAMGALLKICEDNKKAMDKDYGGQRPLDFLFPKFLEFTASPVAKVRAYSIAAMNVFIPEKPQAVGQHIDNLLGRLFQLASDPSDDVRKHMCRAIIHIADISPERIAPHMEGLVDFMVVQQRNQDDPELAQDAAEFWLCVGEDQNLRDGLGPHLPKIVPVLLESMVYAEDDVLRLEADDDEDADVEDKAEDIKPVFATNKGSRLQGSANGNESAPNGASKEAGYSEEGELSEGEIEEDDDDESDFGDPEDGWNLRKCSAAALDVLASTFHGPVFEVTLPYLKDNLVHPEWPNREAAVLALGAIADGCMDVVQPHLPDLTQYLITLLNDKQPVVRQITCWSLGRYSGWAASLDRAGQEQYFVPVMDGLLRRMLDPNKRVQEAAASAFANLEEKAGQNLRDYCEVIINHFDKCFNQYKDRNMFILYDCVQTLAEHVGPALQNNNYSATLMNALIKRWKKVSDQSRELFPLLECLSYVATALKYNFAPYAPPIFERCIRIIRDNLQEEWNASQGQGLDVPDKDFLVTALDLLSAVIQALDPAASAQLVASSDPNLFQLMAMCMKDNNSDVRQSAYALLGDCAIYVFPQLQQYLQQIIETTISQLELSQIENDHATGYSVINNACWSIGEIAMRQREGMAPYVPQLLPKLATILFNEKVPSSLNENAAIAIGRLGIGCAEALAPLLNQFCVPFVKVISQVDWTDEKSHALKGFVNVVLRNPAAMESCLLQFFNELACAPKMFLESVPEGEGAGERLGTFQKVFDVYKGMISDFSGFLNNLPADKAEILRNTYNL